MAACALALAGCLAMALSETRDWRAGGAAYEETAARAVTLLSGAPTPAPAAAISAGTAQRQTAASPAPELPPVASTFRS